MQFRKLLESFNVREVAWTPKAEIIYEKENAVKEGFSGPTEVMYTSFLV